MFDFEKLEVYQKAKSFNKTVYHYIQATKAIDTTTKGQLRRASFSIMLNIAEGSSRFSNADRRNFYVIARGSVFECVAILDILKDTEIISNETFETLVKNADELSRIPYATI